MNSQDDRIAQLSTNLADTRKRMERACRSANRDVQELTLIAVTKTWPASDVKILADLGVTDMGESKEQEGHLKVDQLKADQLKADQVDAAIRWHFIGQLQRNKVQRVAQWADVIHSVDRLSLVEALAKVERATPMEALIQVNLDGDPSRGGVVPSELGALSDAIEASPILTLRGLMAVAPLEEDADSAFARLAAIREEFLRSHPDARWLSAGMSGDMEAAVAHGATHVRMGSSLLGSRPILR
jgi:PLP dependent protein